MRLSLIIELLIIFLLLAFAASRVIDSGQHDDYQRKISNSKIQRQEAPAPVQTPIIAVPLETVQSVELNIIPVQQAVQAFAEQQEAVAQQEAEVAAEAVEAVADQQQAEVVQELQQEEAQVEAEQQVAQEVVQVAQQQQENVQQVTEEQVIETTPAPQEVIQQEEEVTSPKPQQQVTSPTPPSITQVAEPSSTLAPVTQEPPQRACTCQDLTCSCCREFPRLPLLRGPACAKVTYIDEDAMSLMLTFGNRVLHNTTVTGDRPQPVCMSLPGRITQFCARLYGITRRGQQNDYFRACLGFEIRSLGNVEAGIRATCFRFGPQGLDLEPAPPLPSDPVETQDPDYEGEEVPDYEGDDEDDDDDDDEGGLFGGGAGDDDDEGGAGGGDDDDDDDDDDDFFGGDDDDDFRDLLGLMSENKDISVSKSNKPSSLSTDVTSSETEKSGSRSNDLKKKTHHPY